MKKISSVLLLFILSMQLSNSYAQGDFAPIGATWYYSWASNEMEDVGYFVYESVGDTTIQGQVCRNIKGTLFSKTNTPSAGVDTSDYPGLCVYSNSDTVFYYDVDLDRFLPLYIFNVNVGDTVKYWVPGYIAGIVQDSIFRMRVTDITYDDLEGITSKTIHHEPLDFMGFGYSWNSPINEKIGTMHSGPLLSIIPSVVGAYFPSKIRCYSDNEVFYQRHPDIPCDPIENPSGIKERAAIGSIKVYPNPARDYVALVNASEDHPVTSIEVYDMVGRKVKTVAFGNTDQEHILSLADLPAGTYVLKIRSKERSVNRKLTVR